jgi:ABC-2 type transport system ATP-binding protein
MHGRLYGMDRKKINERIAEVLKIAELTDRKNDIVRTFSGGMRRRLEIARGLMHFPKILFLDEPTIGLDPQTREHIWEYVANLNKKHGVTVILTTHYMEEAEKLCDRISIIDHAKIIITGTTLELKDKLNGKSVISIKTAKDMMGRFKSLLKKQKSIKKIQATEETINITVSDEKTAFPLILNIATKNKIKLESIEVHKPSLNDVFIHFTGRDIRKEDAEGNMSAMMRSRFRK